MASTEPAVFVLGHRGMLGHVVQRWLKEQGYKVVTSDQRYDGSIECQLIRDVAESQCETIVNCMGETARSGASGSALFAVNALLPQQLSVLMNAKQLLIHASSDGVFSGIRGDRSIHDALDANDSYGLSKRLGETCMMLSQRVAIIRCSIVGPSLDSKKSLLSWAISQHAPLNGFTDQFWNGITTLEWAKICCCIIRGERGMGPRLYQPGSLPSISKHLLLTEILQAFGSSVQVVPVQSGRPIDRTLRATDELPPIGEQLRSLYDWYTSETLVT